MKISDTGQPYWRPLGFQDLIEVRVPASLRVEIAAALTAAYAGYSSDTTSHAEMR